MYCYDIVPAFSDRTHTLCRGRGRDLSPCCWLEKRRGFKSRRNTVSYAAGLFAFDFRCSAAFLDRRQRAKKRAVLTLEGDWTRGGALLAEGALGLDNLRELLLLLRDISSPFAASIFADLRRFVSTTLLLTLSMRL